MAIGIALSGREVGLAVADRERVSFFRVLNLRKVQSHEGRQARFRQVVGGLVERHPHCPVVAVLASLPFTRTDIASERAWLQEQAASRTLVEHVGDTLRRRFSIGSKVPSARSLAEHLAGEYQELWSKAPSAVSRPGADVVPASATRAACRTPRERYWARAFLALAGVRAHLDDQILEEFAPHPL
jgi:hypothetical protein